MLELTEESVSWGKTVMASSMARLERVLENGVLAYGDISTVETISTNWLI